MTRLAYSIPKVPREPMSKQEFERRQAALLERYPTMFDRLIREDALQIEPGWFPVVELLCDEVNKLLPFRLRKAFHWDQIKEKFGGLRAYFAGGPYYLDVLGQGTVLVPDQTRKHSLTDTQIDAIQALVSEAEKLSYQICQYCGSRGKTRNLEGILATLCERCAKASKHPLG